MQNLVNSAGMPGQEYQSHGTIMNVKLIEAPSCNRAASTVVFVGTNGRGNWVARERNGFFGGLFLNRAQALKYALSQNGHHAETVFEVSREIELDIPNNT
ncbi:hypothetical protein ABIB80_004543 [Bradyrhizobium sp. i1.15.2]|uniref:hypothetical protein n=1 Tax=Bradyrhizobium sp. i1.15.2 TaxID=3156362 RepID=UPI0033915612